MFADTNPKSNMLQETSFPSKKVTSRVESTSESPHSLQMARGESEKVSLPSRLASYSRSAEFIIGSGFSSTITGSEEANVDSWIVLMLGSVV